MKEDAPKPPGGSGEHLRLILKDLTKNSTPKSLIANILLASLL